MGELPATAWLNTLLALLQAVQVGLLDGLQRLGLAQESHGQPAWPWALRVSGENLLIDMGQARHLAVSLVLAGLAVALLLPLTVLVFKRRRRSAGAVAGLALALLVFAPWPEARVVMVPADPTSFHRSPTGFSAQSVVAGGRVYAAQCVACHGVDGRGEGPSAAAQPVWPPDLAGPLLWRRADGDLFWRIRHGLRDRHGATTMAGLADKLSDSQTWAVIDYLKAQAAGQGLRRTGAWERPVAVPDFLVRCDGRPPRLMSDWRARRQRLRLVAEGTGPRPMEDPRLATVLVRSPDGGGTSGIDCIADSPDAWQALALMAGSAPGAFAGTQLIADRDGWLRARGEPGLAAWSDDDLLCRNEGPRPATKKTAAADGLGSLLARMDAEPVRFVKGGFVH
jgi:mono/diheme cytochrome c family protein